jgi:hypothetical protein
MHGHFVALGQLSGPPPALTGNNLVLAFFARVRAYQNRLQNTPLANGVCQFLKGGRFHNLPRLEWPGNKGFNRKNAHSTTLVFRFIPF